jgi:hypothetical protein
MSRLADLALTQFLCSFAAVQADLFIVQPDGPVDGAEIELIND